MSSIEKYESLKTDGTFIDRVQFILSLTDKTQLEQHLKQSLTTSYDDLQTFLFLSNINKNQKNLFEIFKTDSLPTKLRTYAIKSWIKLQKDQKQIEDFIIQSINDQNLPRYIKHQMLKHLHYINHLKNSSSFFYDLACRLTETNDHEQYNIDGHLLPYCKKEQIFDLLSRWSITRLEQIDSSSILYFKLIGYQPSIIIHLIKEDLKEKKKTNYEKFTKYFRENQKLIEFIFKKEPKELICLVIDYLNELDKHQRFLPDLFQSKQKYFFKKVPNEMIQLINIAASNPPGSIKYKSYWGDYISDFGSFSFPRSFSIDNYIKLFLSLYEQCNWSSNNTNDLLQYMFQNKNENPSLSSIKKRRKWFYDIIVQQKIGKDLFLKKLLREAKDNTLDLLDEYPDLTTPISIHLLTKYECEGIVKAPQRLSLIRYQTMTKELFDEFLSLFKQTGSDVNQRQQNYPLLFQSALSTNEEYLKNVLQWIEKRFTNEQLNVIEFFLQKLSSSNNKFQLEILPNNIQSIQSIIDIAINHLQQSKNTLQIINNYGLNLLKKSEQHQNKQQKEIIQTFAIQIIKRCFSKDYSIQFSIGSISESYPQTRDIILDILINDLFPKLISKCDIDQLNNLLSSCNQKFWCVPSLDSFLNSFFTQSLPSSLKLQSSFKIDQHSSIILLYLKNKLTRFERVNYLIHQIDQIFFIDQNIQRILLQSQQDHQFINQLIKDNKSITLDQLSNEQTVFATILNSSTKKLKLPGFDINVLNTYSNLLTGKQQEHITNIILNDYLQDKEVFNLDKLKSLRVLRRLTHTYDQTLQWIHQNQDSTLAITNPEEVSSWRVRGAAVQPLDDIIICLPSTFDLTPQFLFKHFQLLKTKLNAKNAKYISDAMLNISRKISDEIFLKDILQFIQNEQFPKLGVTANKEILRLLNEYISDPSLIENILKPLWSNHPHQDVRACLILTILHFVSKSKSIDNENIIWNILEEAANDDYLPVVQCLFSAERGLSRWSLTQLKNSSNPLFEIFVNRIQFKVLDHPKSLEARVWAWSNIDYEYCDQFKLIEKVEQLCILFDKNGKQLWENAFNKILFLYKLNKISSIDIIINVIKRIMSLREGIDLKENAVDNQHDLPVYHRIQRLLTNLNSKINEFDNEKKLSFRSLTPIILQFDKTLSLELGILLMKISQNKEDIEDLLKLFQENLPKNYFETILIELSKVIIKKNAPSFIQQLNVYEKLELAEWFIKEKNRPLFVFHLLKKFVFNESYINLDACQNLLRQYRENEDLYLRQQAMEYTVPWSEDGHIGNNGDQTSVLKESDDSDSDMS